MMSFQRWFSSLMLLAGLILATGYWSATSRAADEPAEPAADQAEAPQVSYELPKEQTVESLVAFMEQIEKFRPKTQAEAIKHMQLLREPYLAAAKKIVEIETDKKSAAYKKCGRIVAQAEAQAFAQNLMKAEPEQLAAMVDEELQKFSAEKELTDAHAQKLMMMASILEDRESAELATKVLETGVKRFANAESDDFKMMGARMEGILRRMKLLGNSMEIEGPLLDEQPVDWASYRGKVVLVDFWATWCGPCRMETPNVKHNYELYHEKGFDVLGISLDNDREALKKVVEEEELPWKTIYTGDGWKTPLAVKYGVQGIPCVILIDQQGKVVSLNARGPELGRLLAELLGPVEEPAAEENATDGGKG